MKRIVLVCLALFVCLPLLAQNTAGLKKTGAYIADSDFENVLVLKNFNSVSEIAMPHKNLVNQWLLKSEKDICKLCEESFVEVNPIWSDANQFPAEIIMRYIIRPSAQVVELNYTYNIINHFNENALITKLVEVHSGIEKIINEHREPENNLITKKIAVVPGRSYYIDVVAKYASKQHQTIFQFDSLKVSEQILSGTMVFNPHNK
ncbi:hypothetical protein K5I29_06780 [Flavobacterium agricola]|uniref:Uncharacterized protein n=1 Tax=Flavobacterium agricola TaxID=2870839 RepID=A0ABY6M1X0_9FLAO|nr:hypothetical protein [Flavobacterium agricola]UYW02569.1 hypothetical protein K5I29_06780 [Flavobacterium agricola]